MTIGPKVPQVNPWLAGLGGGLQGLSEMFAKIAQQRIFDDQYARKQFEEDRSYQLQVGNQDLERKRYEQLAAQAAFSQNLQTQQHEFQKSEAAGDATQRRFTNTRALIGDAAPNQFLPDALASAGQEFGMPMNFGVSPSRATGTSVSPIPGLDFQAEEISMGRPGFSRAESPQEAYMRTQQGIMTRSADRADTEFNQKTLALAALRNGFAGEADYMLMGAQDPNAAHQRRLAEIRAQNEGINQRTLNQNLINDFTGFDAQGIPQFRRVQDQPGVVVRQEPSQMPNMTGAQASALAQGNTFINEIDHIVKTGDAAKWKGIGPVESWWDATKFQYGGEKVAGKGAAERENLRALMNNLRVELGHEKFGAAFTETERKQLMTIISSADAHPDQARQRLETAKGIAQRALDAKHAAYQQRSGRGGGAVGPNTTTTPVEFDINKYLEILGPPGGKK